MLDNWSCVAISGVMWQDPTNRFILWQSEDPNTILITPMQPTLATDPVNPARYLASVNVLQDPSTDKYTEGTVSFTLNTGIPADPQKLQALESQWKTLMQNDPVNQGPANPVFRSLDVQNATATIVEDPVWGTWLNPNNVEGAIGSLGGMASFDITLNEAGANAYVDALTSPTTKPATGSVVLAYQYLRLLPTCKVIVTLTGSKLYDYLKAQLSVSAGSILVGSSAQVSAALSGLWQSDAINVQFEGTPPNFPGFDLQTWLKTFMDPVVTAITSDLFKPVTTPTNITNPSPLANLKAWGANLQLQMESDQTHINSNINMEFNAASWLNATMDANFGALFADLNSTYLNIVKMQSVVPVHATVVPANDPPVVNAVDIVLTATPTDGNAIIKNGHFTSTGGIIDFIVATNDPADLKVDSLAQIAYAADPAFGAAKIQRSGLGPDGAQVVVATASLLRQLSIYMAVLDAQGNAVTTDTSTLTVEITLTDPVIPGGSCKSSGALSQSSPLRASWQVADGSSSSSTTITIGAAGPVAGHFVTLPATTITSSVFLVVQNNAVTVVPI